MRSAPSPALTARAVTIIEHRDSPARPAPNTGWVIDHRSTTRVQAMTHGTDTVWTGHRLAAISTALDAEYRGLVVPTNHLSVAVPGHDRRPTDTEMTTVRAAFDLVDAEEDNHSPGVARHLFLPLHLPRGTQSICDCKTDETLVVEPDGHRWSRPIGANR